MRVAFFALRSKLSFFRVECRTGSGCISFAWTEYYKVLLHVVRAILNENARTKQKQQLKQTEIERFDWFIERIQTCVAFGWLRERRGEKHFTLENFLEINRYFALTSYYNTIGQSNNAPPF